jgi:predicted RNA-binding protein with EMAP domain
MGRPKAPPPYREPDRLRAGDRIRVRGVTAAGPFAGEAMVLRTHPRLPELRVRLADTGGRELTIATDDVVGMEGAS